jgi:hypothetical protein
MKLLPDTNVLVSAAELGEVIGADLETVNNWVRRDIINRAPIGGRQLRHRLFSTEEVYKTALKNELVKLGIPPSPASDAINELWREWDRKDSLQGKNIYAVISPINHNWSVLLCWQKLSGGPLFKLGKPSTSQPEEIGLPTRAFAMIPISNVFACVTNKLAELLNDTRRARTKMPRRKL